MPGAMLPTRCARPSARAALTVIPVSASSGVRPNKVHAMFIARVGDSIGEVPGLQSVATAIATLCLRSIADRRLARFLERVKGARQEHRDGAGRGHRLGAGLVEMLEMVGAERMIFCGQRGALLIGQLLGVETHREAVRGRGLEQPLDLLGGERHAFAKGVDAGREAGLGRGGDELVDHLADVVRAAVLFGGGNGVEREERGHDAHGGVFTEAPGDLQQTQFAIGRQAVA